MSWNAAQSGDCGTVVIGAGPAGSAAALVLAQRGHAVHLLERDAFPRRKVCGSCLNTGCPPLWRALGVADQLAPLPHYVIPALQLESGSARARARIEHEETALDRAVLDLALARAAQAAGATFLDATPVRSLAREGDRWRIDTPGGVLRARRVILAEGRTQPLARSIRLARHGRACSRVGWQAAFPADEAGALDAVRMRFFRGGYFGLTPLGDGRANVAMILDRARREEPDAVFARETGIRVARGDWKAIAPITRAAGAMSAHHLLVAGDALRVVEPFTGEGIYFAVRTGMAAAATVVSHELSGDWDAAAKEYARAVRAIYAPRLWFNRAVSFLCRHPRAASALVGLLAVHPAWPGLLARPVLRPV
jgi:flavin-dependent dehydrogenase